MLVNSGSAHCGESGEFEGGGNTVRTDNRLAYQLGELARERFQNQSCLLSAVPETTVAGNLWPQSYLAKRARAIAAISSRRCLGASTSASVP